MTAPRASDHRRRIADRNVAAILDAAQTLLERQAATSIAAVAATAGVSRVTVYAHFASWEALLEAVVERATRRTTAALEEADPDHGPPLEALERVVAVGWRELARNRAMAQASGEQLSPVALARAHHPIHSRLGRLVERGRADGSFRTDLPAAWLPTGALALAHACAQEVRAGRLDEADAVHLLTVTIRDLFTGPGHR
jgi:TetR/AcrR family transcriptional regulator, mexCD-oprJ operon repressor